MGKGAVDVNFDCYIKEVYVCNLVFDSRLEISQEGERLIVLDLAELNWATAQGVIQLGGKDGSSATLILGAFIT